MIILILSIALTIPMMMLLKIQRLKDLYKLLLSVLGVIKVLVTCEVLQLTLQWVDLVKVMMESIVKHRKPNGGRL